MKWFYHKPLSSDPVELIGQCVEYLNKAGELPERDATINLLFDVMKNTPVPKDLLKKVIRLQVHKINFWLAIFGDSDVIDVLLQCELGEQGIIANMLSNKNLRAKHLDEIENQCDDTPKGRSNLELVEWKRGRVRKDLLGHG